MSTSLANQDRLRIFGLLSPAYLWLTVAIFLPLSAMLYFSFLSDIPFGDVEWNYSTENYAAFFSNLDLRNAFVEIHSPWTVRNRNFGHRWIPLCLCAC